MADIKFTGGKELDRALGKLPDKVSTKIERKAVRFAMKPVLETARARAPVDTGAGQRSLRITSRQRKKRGVVYAQVDTGKGNLSVGDTFYLGFYEYGTKERQTKSGRRLGKIDETRWLRNSLDDNAPIVVERFTGELRRILKEEAADMVRKAKA